MIGFLSVSLRSLRFAFWSHAMNLNDITHAIIGAAIKVHKALGPGLLESAYEACVAYELEKLGLRVERQKPIPVIYEGVHLECGFRADLLVEGQVSHRGTEGQGSDPS